MMTDHDWRARARIAAGLDPKMPFEEKVASIGLNPARDFQHRYWVDVDFAGSNLAGFDFSGANLSGARFRGARISDARFDRAILGRVLHRPGRDPHLPAETTGIANLREAADWATFADQRSWQPSPRTPGDDHLPIGAIFQDAPGISPEVVVLPPGTYLQGDETKPVDGLNRREVTIGYRIAVGRFAVTFDDWDVCYADGGTKHQPETSWGRGRQPVIKVSWNDIIDDYLPWLNRRLGLSGANAYRLLTEAEWEYACRARTETAYSFGTSISNSEALFDSERTEEVGSFPANAFGLHDMHGNVFEWCEDAWHFSYEGAPTNGTARTSGEKSSSRVLRGDSWNSDPQNLRSANRSRNQPDDRSRKSGFRLARTLLPTP